MVLTIRKSCILLKTTKIVKRKSGYVEMESSSISGILLTIEGPEGSGKTTQVNLLSERLAALGREVLKVRAPGGTPVGESIRGVLQHDTAGEAPVAVAEVFLFLASHAQLARTVIRPALERGVVVICDRYVDSMVAYQGYGRGLGADMIRSLGNFAVDGLVPDRTVLLDLEVETGRSRLTGKLDRIEREPLDFHMRVRDGFLKEAEREPSRFAVVDASRDLDSVIRDVWEALSPLFS